MNSVLIELGVNPENSTESKLLAEKYNEETIFVSRIFTRFLQGWRPKDLLKIAILIVDSHEKEMIIPPNRLTKACAIYRHFDWGAFDQESNQTNRYKILLDWVLVILERESSRFDWPVEVFTTAYNEVVASGFLNEYYLLQPKSSPDRNHSASLSVRIDRECSIIFLQISNAKGDIKKQEIVKIAQYKDDFGIAESVRWLDNNEIVVSNKDKELNFKYSLVSQTVEIFLDPKIHDEKYLQDELKLLSPSTSKEERLMIINNRIDSIKKGK